MAGGHPSVVRIDADAPVAAAALVEAVTAGESVLVHGADVVFVDGAVDELARLLHRPYRRLVRVHTAGGPCYVARAELLAAAVRHGIPATRLVADPPGLDRELARATHAVPLEGRTPVDDPAVGQWRQWVDGAVIGVRTATAAESGRTDEAAHRSRVRANATAVLRRHAGRVRREVVRLRQRPRPSDSQR